jgi:hypothetical protein
MLGCFSSGLGGGTEDGGPDEPDGVLCALATGDVASWRPLPRVHATRVLAPRMHAGITKKRPIVRSLIRPKFLRHALVTETAGPRKR